MKKFNEWLENRMLLEFDPNRGAEGRSVPNGLGNFNPMSWHADDILKGKRDAKCNAITDPYQKFKCQLMISAKNSTSGFHHLIPSQRPWDGQQWTSEEIKDLKKAYEQANWRRRSENDLRQGRRLNRDSKIPGTRMHPNIPNNPAEDLAQKLNRQEIEIEKSRLSRST